MCKIPLVTKQNGGDGQSVSKVLVVDAGPKIVREVYVGVVLDRTIGLPILMACAEGGVEIEDVAARSPEKILKAVVDPDAGLRPYQAPRLPSVPPFPPHTPPKPRPTIPPLPPLFPPN